MRGSLLSTTSTTTNYLVTLFSSLPKKRRSNVRIDTSFWLSFTNSGPTGFYASLGCSYLSVVIKDGYQDLREIPSIETCHKIQSLVLERLPLFVQKYTNTKLKVSIPSSADDLKVKACERILVCKILVTTKEKRTKYLSAIARLEGGCVELWIAKTRKCDMYE